ncbi:MAG TPA: hypothetical protein VNT03_03880, partial [Baekduia sp.]|nr:hypothetical protein [Baekduia sp.]
MTDLRNDLRALAGEVDWPETPDLAGAVRTRLTATAASIDAGAVAGRDAGHAARGGVAGRAPRRPRL